MYARIISDIIDSIENHIEDEDEKRSVYDDLIDLIEEYDFNPKELVRASLIFDELLYDKYPEVFEDFDHEDD